MSTSITQPSPQQPPRGPGGKRHHPLLRIAAWVAGSLVVLLVLVAITVTILLHSDRFHTYVLNKVESQASEALGVQVQLENYTLHLATLSLDLWGVTVHGASPYPDPPLLQVDHAEAGVRVISVLHQKWYLDRFIVDRPIVRVFVDSKGVSNIPTFKSSSSNTSSNTSVFDLGVRHAVLNRGEVYYNDKKSVLAADLHDLDFRSTFDNSQQKYSGNIAYSDGHLVSGTMKTIPHSFAAHFDATPTSFYLSQAKLTSGPSQLLLTATLQNYSNPNLQGRYDATVDGRQIQEILGSPSIPSGAVRATGTIQYQQVANRAFLDALFVDGDVSSARLDVKASSIRTQIENIAGHYSLVNGNATLKDFHASLLGGELTASGKMSHISGDSNTEVIAGLREISLADLKRLAGSSAATKSVGISGVLNAKATATWGKTIDDLVAHTDATISGRVSGGMSNVSSLHRSNVRIAKSGVLQVSQKTAASVTQPAQNFISVESAIHGVYTNHNQQISLTNSYLRTPQTNLTLNGTVSNNSSLDIRLQADDLREIETIVDLFRTPTAGQALQPLGLAGTASFHGAVKGSTAAPHVTGQFIASNFDINGSEWKVLRTNIDASPSGASLQHADLEPVSGGHITIDASAGLSKWSLLNTSPMQVNLDASQLNIADLAKLAGQQVPVSGMLNASVKVHGTELSPEGTGNVSLTNVNAYEQPIQAIKLNFAGTGDEAHGDLTVSLPTGGLQSKFSVRPKARTYTAQLTATDIHLDKLQALKAKNIDATGVLSINANGQGTFDNPQVDATIQIPQLAIQKQTITALNLHVNISNHVGTANLTTSAINTSIRANAKVNLSGDYEADASLDTQAIPLQPLVAVYAPAQANDVTGQTEVHATLHGPLKKQNLLEAHVTIPVLRLGYSNTVQLAATSPIRVDYKNGLVNLQRSSIKGTDTDLEFEGSIPTTGNGPMALLLQGTVNLQLAQLFEPDIRTSGELKFNINSHGPTSSADIGGEIDIVDANYASGDLPVGLSHGNGVLTLTKSRLNISKFEGTVGSGTVTAQGGVTYSPSVQFDLGLAAQGIRVLYPQGVRESVDANIRLAGTTDNAVLGGSVNLSDLSFTSAFDLNSFIGQFSGGVSSPPTGGIAQNIQLNLAVRSTNDVNLISRTLSIGGSANLQVRGSAANPVILGRVNLNNGDIILNGSRFVLTGGTIQFVNPSETEPVVNVSLNTSIQQYNIFLRFNGPVSQLRTDYSSDPALPAADIINLLAFGSTTEASAQNSTPANQQAESLVASQVSSQVTSRVSKIAGISQLSISPVLAGSSNQGPPGANITIQQRVTGNLFVTFSSNVASTQSQTIQGQYQLSPRVAVSATRDQNGGFAFDALIKKGW